MVETRDFAQGLSDSIVLVDDQSTTLNPQTFILRAMTIFSVRVLVEDRPVPVIWEFIVSGGNVMRGSRALDRCRLCIDSDREEILRQLPVRVEISHCLDNTLNDIWPIRKLDHVPHRS
jgi:hypothetical protein